MTLLLVAAAAIFVGSTLQRLSGTGVGLVVSPTLALLLGPATGVLVTNATTTVSGFLCMLAVRRDVEWRRAGLICAAAVLGAVPGALLVRALPAAWLQVVIGGTVVLALATTFALPRLPRLHGRAVTALAGAVGGLFNTTAGVAAPIMVIYARVSRWEQVPFAATLQPVFMTMGFLSVTAKTLLRATGPAGVPPWWAAPAIALVVAAGIATGGRLSSWVPPPRARLLAIALAGLGGLLTLVRGLLALASG